LIVFCDTSALYAVGNRDDEYHTVAARLWEELVGNSRYRPITTNYVFVETFTLAQRRRGLAAARAVAEALKDALDVAFIDEALHQAGVEECLAEGKRDVSLVDYTSFAFMRRTGIQVAFAFDRHFSDRGFKPIERPM
jgi:uncharacterized protein